MANQTNYMLRRTREALQAQLKYLEHTARPENSKRKHEAYVTGGIHENSAWEAAIQDEKVIDHHIAVIGARLLGSSIIEELALDPNTVGIGRAVLVDDVETNKQFRYVFVGPAEGGIETQSGLLVSADAPLARALIGAQVGDEIEVLAGRKRRLLVREIDIYVDDRSDDQLV